MARASIAIDFDGTLADTNRAKSEWLRLNLRREVPSWLCDRTDCIPLIGREAYNKMGRDVYSAASTARTNPVEGAADAIVKLAAKARILIITKRTTKQAEYVSEWLAKNGLAAHIDEVISSAEAEKSDLCLSRNVLLLLDDDIRHLVPLIGSGIGLHLFKPTADVRSLPKEIEHARSWSDFKERALIVLAEGQPD